MSEPALFQILSNPVLHCSVCLCPVKQCPACLSVHSRNFDVLQTAW